MNKPLIYVTDNEADYLHLVQYVFVEFLPEYAVLLFSSGETLLNSLQTNPERPSLLLLDLHMPEMSGQQTLQQLKARQDWKPIPVVMITSETAEGEIQACYQAGANSCLAKPMNIDAMKKLFKQVCAYWVDTRSGIVP
ncbi:response regulator [Spirosoma pollinicola]|uniref:Response regulator n=1 Tax=Spirosoma pollinicola TaxID=2057025 RepID=A0A2K8YS81_9BACT|nr:response regulator [Spirosoma pollinicola]AUD00434.1 response regulator [Spirosoma pollinicola]